MVSEPFVDNVPANAFIIPRGRIDFLKTALKSGSSLLAPDTDAFAYIDLVRIFDPDDNDVTADWETIALDPDDDDDIYDDTHAKYVGNASKRTVTDGVTNNGSPTLTSATAAFVAGSDVGKAVVGAGIPGGTTISAVVSATQATMSANATATATGLTVVIGTPNIGLFHNGGGRMAQKIKAPDDAEVTTSSTTRLWKVTWRVKKNDSFIENSENFNVAEAGVLVFNVDVVTVAEVERGIVTNLTDPEIEDIIVEATDQIEGLLDACGIDVDGFTEIPPLVRNGIIKWSRGLIFQRDSLATGGQIIRVKEGPVEVGYSSTSVRTSISDYFDEARIDIATYCKRHGPLKRPRLRVTRQLPGDGAFVLDGEIDTAITLGR
jgi:hypothetical protein